MLFLPCDRLRALFLLLAFLGSANGANVGNDNVLPFISNIHGSYKPNLHYHHVEQSLVQFVSWDGLRWNSEEVVEKFV